MIKTVALLCAIFMFGCSQTKENKGFVQSNSADGGSQPHAANGTDGKQGPQGAQGPAGTPATELENSGTRLKTRYATESYTDGADRTYFLGFYDSLRKENCSFYEGYGKYCLPIENFASYSDSDSYYSDPQCFNVAVISYVTNIKYIIYLNYNRIYKVGDKVQKVYLKSNNVCYLLDTSFAYNIGSEIPMSEFVEGSITYFTK